MDSSKNTFSNRLNEQLPKHVPDADSWQKLSARLDALDAEKALHEKLENLPLHKPDADTWAHILFRLNRKAAYKTTIRVALSAAAGLLLLFAVSGLLNRSSQNQNKGGNSTLNPIASADKNLTPQPELIMPASQDKKVEGNLTNQQTPGDNSWSASPMIAFVEPQPADETSPAEFQLAFDEPYAIENYNGNESWAFTPEIISFIANSVNPGSRNAITSLTPATENSAANKPLKYYTPDEKLPGRKNNHFALAMDYLPENISNGNGNSMFHNVDVTASYNKEKVRFNTSLGMAYNEEQLVFAMNYNVNTPVLATGPDGSRDTVGYDVAMLESQYQGTEKHQYLTYNLGIGKRLFQIGKFSSWINAGAGFGLKLNEPDLIASTKKNLTNQLDAEVTEVTSNKPLYNDVNVNFVTGIDFNYRILNHLSISFTPTSRWYFKPVLSQNNQATDELTLGFKTGVKFEF